MRAHEMQAVILNLLKTQELTADQLLGQLNADLKASGQPAERAVRVRQTLTAMLYAGKLERTIDESKIARFRLPEAPRYTWHEDVLFDYVVTREGVVIGSYMTEAEARVCVQALNDHDRKVRALKNRK